MIASDNYKEARNLGDLIRNAVKKDDGLRFDKYYEMGIVMDFFSTIDNIDDFVNSININEIL